jgi:hypothetical protein
VLAPNDTFLGAADDILGPLEDHFLDIFDYFAKLLGGARNK